MVLLSHKPTHSHIHVFFALSQTSASNDCALAGIVIDKKPPSGSLPPAFAITTQYCPPSQSPLTMIYMSCPFCSNCCWYLVDIGYVRSFSRGRRSTTAGLGWDWATTDSRLYSSKSQVYMSIGGLNDLNEINLSHPSQSRPWCLGNAPSICPVVR